MVDIIAHLKFFSRILEKDFFPPLPNGRMLHRLESGDLGANPSAAVY